MKKILAILLSLTMLLSAFAVAEGGSLAVENVQVSSNGEMLIDLSGLALALAAAQSENGMGLRVALDYGTDDADEAVAWISDTALALKASFLSSAYYMELGSVMDALEGEISEDSAEELIQTLSEEDAAAIAAIAQAVEEVGQAGVTDAGEVEIDGVRYQAVDIDIDAEASGQVMDAVFALLDNHPELLEDSAYESFSALRAEVNPSVSVAGRVCTGENGAIVDLTFGFAVNMLPDGVTLNLYAKSEAGDAEGDRKIHIVLTVDAMDENIALAMDVALAKDEGAWIPGQLGDAVNVMDVLSDTAQQEKVSGEAMSFAMRLLSNVTYILQQNATAA